MMHQSGSCAPPTTSSAVTAYRRSGSTRSSPSRTSRKPPLPPFSVQGGARGRRGRAAQELWSRDWLEAEARRRSRTPDETLLAVFDVLSEWFRREDYEGCLFINTLLEVHDPTNPVAEASLAALANVRSFIRGLAEEVGVADPDDFAWSWHSLMWGSSSPPRSATRTPPIAPAHRRDAAPTRATMIRRGGGLGAGGACSWIVGGFGPWRSRCSIIRGLSRRGLRRYWVEWRSSAEGWLASSAPSSTRSSTISSRKRRSPPRQVADALEGRPAFVWLAEKPAPHQLDASGAETLKFVEMQG